ncbi:MAG: hypothetical protein M3441_15495 [Chloroflexota bacterium]|nr:hypothetical protein [Chloroflexota bacterium]
MLRRVRISWFKQRSGSYALKGITIEEGERAYDSSVSFREQDAEWVTRTLQAQADVEVSGKKEFSQSNEDYPEWALNRGVVTEVEAVSPLERERANASVLRHLLREIMKQVGGNGEGDPAHLQKLMAQANAVLQTTATSTDYSLEEALAILTARDTKPLTGLGQAGRKTLKPR